MKTQTAKKTSLRNEESFVKSGNLPPGTFSRDGQPTIVTQIVALHVVDRMKKICDGEKINTLELRSAIVDHLDSFGLLPASKELTKDQKMTKISMAINFMMRDYDTIQTRHLNIYTACKTALKRSISQVKIAESASR
jgi:hypothetical protein